MSEPQAQRGASPRQPSESDDRRDPPEPDRARALRHDIKTPLQAASLNLELLAMEQQHDRTLREALNVIRRSLDEAIDMLQRLDID